MPSSVGDSTIAESYASAVNDFPISTGLTVVGEVLVHGPHGGFAWSGFRWTLADGVEVLTPHEGAYDVNDNGVVVGDGNAGAHLWNADGSGGTLHSDLLGTYSWASGVNNKTRVVGGYWSNGGDRQGFVWDWYFGMQLMGPLSADYQPTRISDKDRIIGEDRASSRAFTFYKGVFSYLPALAPGQPTYASAVNRCGTIVGTAHDANGSARAVRWSRRVCD